MPRTSRLLALLLAPAVLTYAAGCGGNTPTGPGLATAVAVPDKAPAVNVPEAARDAEHAHKPGGHGGNVVEVGRDNYHAEAVFEPGGRVRVYLLGKDEARVLEVEAQTLSAYARPDGGTEAAAFTLQPEPQPDDAAGKTSRFVGALPEELPGKRVEVTVPSIRIGGERFRFAFTSPAAAHDEGMPGKVADAEEQALYLTPGGRYTEADIRANGGLTASQKFQGAKAAHDLKPRPGDKICPVTLTKANPKFTWVVGGKVYEFCCPPCVDEFVRAAKEHPGQVQEPGEYVKR